MALSGQVAVITGGAGGIGKASAELWLGEGGNVVIADIQKEKGEAFAAEHPGRAVFVYCDTLKRADLEAAAAAAVPLGQLTCWFNNAGYGEPTDHIAALRKTDSIDKLRRMVDVNFNAYVEGTGIALRNFNKERGGTIVSTASMAGLLPIGAPPVYSASKAANVQFTRALGLTLGDASPIRVYGLCPSYTATAGGPPRDQIQKSLGGVLEAEHQAHGFMLLVRQRPPNGSIMRVTVRNRGARVVHDLVVYGRELGGNEKPREGVVLSDAPLVPPAAKL
mmetsp:Transcript_123887/g.264058  ORF Transcript_123887/g.264058 Transcript_123887/m.264058 type:complete len:278 (-) Transcript_123887:78-911(-)